MRISTLLVIATIAGSLGACSTSTEAPGGGTPVAAATATPAKPGDPKQGPADTPPAPPPVDPTNDPAAKPCAGAAGSLYALSARKLDTTTDVPLCRFEGSVLLVVNVASHCGYTPQYEPLQATYDKYRAQGFYVLGFPSQSFNQEDSDEATISKFCTENYKITFPMFSVGNVNPPTQQPVYTWLKSQPGMAADVAWNFEKFLISRHGQIVQRISHDIPPDDPSVVATIEAELAKK